MSRRIPWARIVSGAVGYLAFVAVLWHFLSHREPWDSADLVRAALGVIGLQVGIGKNMIDALDAVTRFAGTVRSGWARSGRTAEHPTPAAKRAAPARARAKRKRPSRAKGRPKD